MSEIDRSIEQAVLKALDRKYWYAAVRNEVEASWGSLYWITDEDKYHIAQMTVIAAYMEATPSNLDVRGDVQEEFMKSVFSGDTISRHRRLMSLDGSIVSKLMTNVCTLYSGTVERRFSDDEAVQSTFTGLYADAGMDQSMQQAYRIARFTNHAAVRTRWGKRDRMKSEVLIPNQYRVRPDPDFPGEVGEMWVPYETETGERRYRVWRDDVVYVTDYRGYPINDAGKTIPDYDMQPNPYGRIPYTFVRLRKPLTDDLYGAGWWGIVAFQVWSNVMSLSNDTSFLFNTFSSIVAINLNLSKQTGFVFQPGETLALDNVMAPQSGMPGQPMEPTLTTLELTGQFAAGNDYRQDRTKETLRNGGLPSFYYDETTPPTGEALKVQERELRRVTDEDRAALMIAEKDSAEQTALTYNRDVWRELETAEGVQHVRVPREPGQAGALPEKLNDFSMDFAEEGSYTAYADDLQQVKDGTMSLRYFYQKWSGDSSVKTDEEAAEKIMKNRELAAMVFSGSAPATPQTEGVNAPPAEPATEPGTAGPAEGPVPSNEAPEAQGSPEEEGLA